MLTSSVIVWQVSVIWWQFLVDLMMIGGRHYFSHYSFVQVMPIRINCYIVYHYKSYQNKILKCLNALLWRKMAHAWFVQSFYYTRANCFKKNGYFVISFNKMIFNRLQSFRLPQNMYIYAIKKYTKFNAIFFNNKKDMLKKEVKNVRSVTKLCDTFQKPPISKHYYG